MASGFLVLISFFTRIPIGNKIEYNEDNFKAALSIYSLVGVVIGIILYFVSSLGNVFQTNYVRGLLLTFGYTIITGGLHLDGSADTADGLFSGRTGDKIFEIMSDSNIGAFGVLCLIFIILSQFVLFSNVNSYICFLVPVVGRAALVVGSYGKKYAKKTKGMGSIFIEAIDTKALITNIIILIIACMFVSYRFILLISAFVTLFFASLISNIIDKKINGMTGDTCGFITEMSQIVFMFTILFINGVLM